MARYMLIRRCAGTSVFLLFAVSTLLIFLPVETLAKERKDRLAQSSPKSLKNKNKEAVTDRFLDDQMQKMPPQARSGKPDIVLTNTLQLSLKDVITSTLKNNVSIAVQQFQSQIRKEEIITQEADFDPSLSFEAKATQERNLLASAFAQPPKSNVNSQSLDLSFNQKLKTGTEYEIKLENSRTETNSAFAGLNPQFTTRLEASLTQPLLKNFGSDVNKTNIYVAKNNLDISDFDFKNKVIEVITDAENVYWDLVFSREDLKVQQKSVERAQDLERRVKAQVEVGTLAPLEILQAKSEVASREEAVIQARKLIQDNQDNLKNILNISLNLT